MAFKSQLYFINPGRGAIPSRNDNVKEESKEPTPSWSSLGSMKVAISRRYNTYTL